MNESESTYKIQGSRVYGNGTSYNCTNVVTAQTLCNTLNGYEKDLRLTKNISKQYDTLNKQIIALQMDLSNVQDTVNQLKETINDLNSNHR